MNPAADGATATLVVRAGERLAAVPLAAVSETMRPLPVQRLPGTSRFVRGVSVVRAEPVPVLDLGALLGGTGEDRVGRFVTLRSADGRAFALAVGDVVGIRQLPQQVLRELSPVLGTESKEVAGAMAVLDEELVVLLRAAVLVPADVWRELDARGAAR